jgi:hypothetical protein
MQADANAHAANTAQADFCAQQKRACLTGVAVGVAWGALCVAFLWTMTLSVCLGGGGTPESPPCAVNKTAAALGASDSEPTAGVEAHKTTNQTDQRVAKPPHRSDCSAESPLGACLARVSWLTAGAFALALVSWFVWAAIQKPMVVVGGQPTVGANVGQSPALYGACDTPHTAAQAAGAASCRLCTQCATCETRMQHAL